MGTYDARGVDHLASIQAARQADIRNHQIDSDIGPQDFKCRWTVPCLEGGKPIFNEKFPDNHANSRLVVDYQHGFSGSGLSDVGRLDATGLFRVSEMPG